MQGRQWLGGLTCAVGMEMFWRVAPVLAQATATPTPGAVTQARGALPALDTARIIGTIVVPLLAGIVLVLFILWYLYQSEGRFYATYQALAPRGTAPQSELVGPFLPFSGVHAMMAGPEQHEQAVTAHVTGPDTAIVGQPSAEFRATAADGMTPLTAATWEVNPADAADVIPRTGAATVVTPKRAGTLTVVMTATDGAKAEKKVVVQPAPMPSGGLPFVGQGYGTLIVIIVLATVVLVLALNGVLDGGAVATFIGGLVGYVFGVVAPQSGAGRRS